MFSFYSPIWPEFRQLLGRLVEIRYCCTPTLTFYSILQRVRKSELGELVVLNVDSNHIETPFDDLERLPPDIVKPTTCFL